MNCPNCGNHGKKVKRITLESLLCDEAQSRIVDTQYYFCDSPECVVAYFADGEVKYTKDDLTVRIGVKEKPGSEDRLVCYCFNHTIEEIEAQVKATGTSTVLDDIKKRIKEGGCWCETTNPMGSCCLGTVAKYINAAVDEFGASGGAVDDERSGRVDEEHSDCCSGGCCCSGKERDEGEAAITSNDKELRVEKAGMFAAAGAVGTAVLSSACCWLPLLLLAFGASAVGVSAWFEKYRLIFLGITALMLAGGFYLVYFRAPGCVEGGASCSTKGHNMRRFTKTMLWVSTAVVIAFAAFPNYIGFVIRASGSNGETSAAVLATLPKITLDIAGMTCAGCAANLENSLAEQDGVAKAKVDFDTKKAEVWLKDDTTVEDAAITETVLDEVAKAGFTGKVLDSGR